MCSYKDKELEADVAAELNAEAELACARIAPRSPALNFLVNLWSQQRGRRLFRTFSGRLGFAHSPVQKGDVICVFDSAPSAHILRPVRCQTEGVYMLISEAYVNGIMNGEVYQLNIHTQNITLV